MLNCWLTCCGLSSGLRRALSRSFCNRFSISLLEFCVLLVRLRGYIISQFHGVLLSISLHLLLVFYIARNRFYGISLIMGPSAMDEYVRIEKIGEGTYGVVFKGKHKKTGELVAIKKIRMDSEDEGIPSTAMREISILKELQHPNIVGLLKVIDENESRLYLIFEFLTMDLKKHLDSYETGKYMSPELLQSYMYQLCQAILFCHKRRILHRDLKPQNLLITGNGVIKLADFGLGRAIGIPVRVFTHEVVTLWYRAPEVLLGSIRYCFPVDMWSIACIFAEMATKKPLFQGDSEIDQLFRIFRVLRTPTEETWPGVSDLPDYKPTFPNWTNYTLESQVKNINKAGLDILSKMLVYNPATRMTAIDAVKHHYFDDIDKSKLPCNYDEIV